MLLKYLQNKVPPKWKNYRKKDKDENATKWNNLPNAPAKYNCNSPRKIISLGLCFKIKQSLQLAGCIEGAAVRG